MVDLWVFSIISNHHNKINMFCTNWEDDNESIGREYKDESWDHEDESIWRDYEDESEDESIGGELTVW